MEEYSEFIQPYEYAMKSIMVKIEALDRDYPIHNIQHRLKKPESILKKLDRRNLKVDLESARENLTDIAGLRVTCYFMEDVYVVEELLKRIPEVVILKERDYIKEPKPNGYRSLHLVVGVPIFYAEDMEYYPVEIQIRTLAMDFWASMEHRISYKQSEVRRKSVYTELLSYSDQLIEIEEKMKRLQNIEKMYKIV